MNGPTTNRQTDTTTPTGGLPPRCPRCERCTIGAVTNGYTVDCAHCGALLQDVAHGPAVSGAADSGIPGPWRAQPAPDSDYEWEVWGPGEYNAAPLCVTTYAPEEMAKAIASLPALLADYRKLRARMSWVTNTLNPTSHSVSADALREKCWEDMRQTLQECPER